TGALETGQFAAVSGARVRLRTPGPLPAHRDQQSAHQTARGSPEYLPPRHALGQISGQLIEVVSVAHVCLLIPHSLGSRPAWAGRPPGAPCRPPLLCGGRCAVPSPAARGPPAPGGPAPSPPPVGPRGRPANAGANRWPGSWIAPRPAPPPRFSASRPRSRGGR